MKKLDGQFNQIFPIILADRDPAFYDFEGIEFNSTTEDLKTNVFYCDAFSKIFGTETLNKFYDAMENYIG